MMSAAGKESPIYSSRVKDPAAEESIDAFVVSLAERIDELQDADARRDFELLGELAQTLTEDADLQGFGALARCADFVSERSRDSDAAEAHKHLVELTRIARRVRLGHAGSM